jgi:hypothetical protein
MVRAERFTSSHADPKVQRTKSLLTRSGINPTEPAYDRLTVEFHLSGRRASHQTLAGCRRKHRSLGRSSRLMDGRSRDRINSRAGMGFEVRVRLNSRLLAQALTRTDVTEPIRGPLQIVIGGKRLIIEVGKARDLFGSRCFYLGALVPFVE